MKKVQQLLCLNMHTKKKNPKPLKLSDLIGRFFTEVFFSDTSEQLKTEYFYQ